MYGLSLGVQRMDERLPDPVYALLSGLNASTVGIIALAAVQLADKAIQDQWTRMLVIFGACGGMLYNALWYFPTLIAVGGICTLMWEGPIKRMLASASRRLRRHRQARTGAMDAEQPDQQSIAIETTNSNANLVQRRTGSPSMASRVTSSEQEPQHEALPPSGDNVSTTEPEHRILLSVGLALVGGFLTSFLAVMLFRGLLNPLPRILALFSNMYLAGTIIFGGMFATSLDDN